MALISDALLSMEKIKLSDLTRISASADLATADYLPFNDASEGTDATRAVTIGGLPVAAANNAGGTGIGGVVAKHLRFETARDTLPSVVNVNLRVIKNTQTAEVVFSDDSVDVFQATGASLSSDTVIQGSFFYQA